MKLKYPVAIVSNNYDKINQLIDIFKAEKEPFQIFNFEMLDNKVEYAYIAFNLRSLLTNPKILDEWGMIKSNRLDSNCYVLIDISIHVGKELSTRHGWNMLKIESKTPPYKIYTIMGVNFFEFGQGVMCKYAVESKSLCLWLSGSYLNIVLTTDGIVNPSLISELTTGLDSTHTSLEKRMLYNSIKDKLISTGVLDINDEIVKLIYEI